MKITDKIELYNCDNMELMAKYPDNYFDLAIVDPPYGIDNEKR
jgi:site-specific DNA-methyltransferase (adenine-specific)